MATVAISFQIFLTLSLISLLVSPAAVVAEDSNVLLTGDTLTTDGQLSYRDSAFIIQDDCNLVLYNKGNGFISDTSGAGANCTLTLNHYGQLIIKTGNRSTVWTSGAPAKKGRYAAILRPDGQVAVYGTAVWLTPKLTENNSADKFYELAGNIPMVRNVLFSSQVLYDGAKLATRDYALVMQDDCNLELTKAGISDPVWASGTAGRGQHCFVRLDHRGRLKVADDQHRTVWASKHGGKQDGDYVLVLQIHGQAVVYGPVVWYTV